MSAIPKTSPTTIQGNGHTTVILFPGQGADASELIKDGKLASEELRKVSQDVLRFDVSRLTVAQLKQTRALQPAIVTKGLDGFERLCRERPDLVREDSNNNVVCAGFSLGEITALAAAGRFSQRDALVLVRERAKAMQKACQDGTPGKMIALFDVEKSDEELPCNVASHLFPGCRVVSGPKLEMDKVKWVPEFASRIKPLEMNGAYHTSHMNPAADAIRGLRGEIEVQPFRSNSSVISNLTGCLYGENDDVLEVLANQVVSTVKWEETMNFISDLSGPVTIVEIGPGHQIETMLKRIPKRPELLREVLYF